MGRQPEPMLAKERERKRDAQDESCTTYSVILQMTFQRYVSSLEPLAASLFKFGYNTNRLLNGGAYIVLHMSSSCSSKLLVHTCETSLRWQPDAHGHAHHVSCLRSHQQATSV